MGLPSKPELAQLVMAIIISESTTLKSMFIILSSVVSLATKVLSTVGTYCVLLDSDSVFEYPKNPATVRGVKRYGVISKIARPNETVFLNAKFLEFKNILLCKYFGRLIWAKQQTTCGYKSPQFNKLFLGVFRR